MIRDVPETVVSTATNTRINTYSCEEGPLKEAHDTQGGGSSNDVGHQPKHKLEAYADDKVQEQHRLLSKAVGWLRKQEAAQQHSSGLAGWHVAYFRDISPSHLDKVVNDPAWCIQSAIMKTP
jgi:hypothetical protein